MFIGREITTIQSYTVFMNGYGQPNARHTFKMDAVLKLCTHNTNLSI